MIGIYISSWELKGQCDVTFESHWSATKRSKTISGGTKQVNPPILTAMAQGREMQTRTSYETVRIDLNLQQK